MSAQSSKPSFADKIRIFGQNVKRVIRVARRPTAHEVRLIARVSGIGILIVGVVAYLIQIVGTLVNQFFNPTSSSSSSSSILIVPIIMSICNCLPAILLNLAASPLLLTIPFGLGLIVRSFKH
ncbi:MAG TPA: protein translocase SEC61 complex subunit gamma [Candidatus Lokiarchaeia archaeon]|nr:protein translocase SEC61 complex subunit gamma [Candidatus Lokiarchaeia archaeon]